MLIFFDIEKHFYLSGRPQTTLCLSLEQHTMLQSQRGTV